MERKAKRAIVQQRIAQLPSGSIIQQVAGQLPEGYGNL
jgi:hypothetical protein